jgi:S-adenosyl-L-methionine hydrolase (adenosine-forming)
MSVITLTTDFGGSDGYVAAMKGIILGLNPAVTLIDITHEIRPQNIAEASFVLSTAYSYFPAGTVHIAVADPGVGTARNAVILRTPTAFFVGPDNGIFTFILRDYQRTQAPLSIIDGRTRLPDTLEAVILTNPKYWRETVSSTFQGRDIFAPVAANLSLGVPFTEFGEKTDEIIVLPGYRPVRLGTGFIIGHVIHLDHFGNVVTDIKASDFGQPPSTVKIEACGHSISRIVKTYAETDGLVALFGSSGYLEIAQRNGSAAKILGAVFGDDVRLTARYGPDSKSKY